MVKLTPGLRAPFQDRVFQKPSLCCLAEFLRDAPGPLLRVFTVCVCFHGMDGVGSACLFPGGSGHFAGEWAGPFHLPAVTLCPHVDPASSEALPDVPSFQNAALASPVTGDILFSKDRASSAPPVCCVDLSWVIGPKGA